MQRVPPEIVSEIFLWVCVRGQKLPHHSNRRQTCLLRVCGRWRDIALTTPEFWSMLKVDMDKLHIDDSSKLDTWLMRSGNCPLDLHVVSKKYGTNPLLAQSADVIKDVLLPHMSRCRSLCAVFPAELWPVLSNCNADASQFLLLEDLTLNVYPITEDQRPIVDFDAFPKLATLTYDGFLSPTNMDFRGMGLALRNINLNVMSSRELIKILSCSPFVTDCSIRIWNDSLIYRRMVVPTFQHSHLELLRIDGFDWSSLHVASMLDRLCLPSLRTLLVFSGKSQWEVERLWSSITQLLQRSRPPLEQLSLHDRSISSNTEELLQCMLHVPTLKSLDINVHFLDMMFWRALTMSGQISSGDLPGNLCPRLEHLKLTYQTTTDTAGILSDIAEMILSREHKRNGSMSACTPLTTLDVAEVSISERQLLNYPGMKSCIEAGLRIVVR